MRKQKLDQTGHQPGALSPDAMESGVNTTLEHLVSLLESQGIPREAIARCMICTAAGLMISERGHEATSAELRRYADSIDQLSVRGNA